MLEIHRLSAGYNGRYVLTDISAEFPEGSLTAVVGPNGSGKSTLLKAISGLIPCSGEVMFQKRRIQSMSSSERAKVLSFLPQSRPVPEITAEKLVLHGRFPYLSYPRNYRKEDHAAALDAMEQLGITNLAQRQLTTLSGGERQRVYLAMTLAQDTPAILMDEPTSFLDISHRFDTVQISKHLASRGKTVISVLHDLDLALRYADQILLLDCGKVICCAPPEEMVQNGSLEAAFHIRIGQIYTPEGTQYTFFPTHADTVNRNDERNIR